MSKPLSQLEVLNGYAEKAREGLMHCCSSTRWVEAMLAQRPFRDPKHVYDCAAICWQRLARADWLEAFSQHPRIGDLRGARSLDDTERTWAEGEQSGAARAAESVRLALAEGNREYEMKFGHVFIVCATGKSGEEMLALLRQRLNHPPEAELAIAAAEEEKITRIRLEKLLSQ